MPRGKEEKKDEVMGFFLGGEKEGGKGEKHLF